VNPLAAGRRAWSGSGRQPATEKGNNVTVSLVRRRSTLGSPETVRQGVQLLALAIYIYLLFAALQRRAAFRWRMSFSGSTAGSVERELGQPRLDPVLLWRLSRCLDLGPRSVWCGWLCPLGTLLEWLRFRSARTG